MNQETFENYSLSTIAVSLFVSLTIYFLGAFLIYQLGFLYLAVYILFIVLLEVRLLKNSCTCCYYYGKKCAFGRGVLSSLLFRKGDSKKFCSRKITWRNILPDMLVSLVPLLAGIALLIFSFDFVLLVAVVILLLFTSLGNGFVRANLACCSCKQRELGCPAEQLFSKKK